MSRPSVRMREDAAMPVHEPASGAAGPRRAAVILAGGRSSRFGTDKTRAEVDGSTLLHRVLAAVERVSPPIDEVVVIGPWAPPGMRHVVEPVRFEGPLAALVFGLEQVTASDVLVLAADHA